jgi:hypothetical protein
MEVDIVPGPFRDGYVFDPFHRSVMVGRKRKRSSVRIFPGRKRRRLLTTRRRLAPPRTGGFYGLNQGNHGPELKDIDQAPATYAADTTGAITLINGVAQGTDFTQRVGRKFTMKSILLRGTAQVGATATSAAWRIMIVYDKQANAAAPLITDILTNVSINGMQNLTNRDRFIVYLDKAGWVEATDKQIQPVKWYKRCRLETINGGTGATIGSIASGALYLLTMGNVVAGATAARINLEIRVRFTDD